mgnify:CR=1 FL=1
MGAPRRHDRRFEIRTSSKSLSRRRGIFFMQKLVVVTIVSLFLISCKFNPNVQGPGADFLQGEWAQDSVLHRDSLLQYTRHRIKFSCDSFYLSLETTSKVNIYPDSCYNNGVWNEYVKGTYQTSGDTLSLYGTFTKSNYKQKISGCYRIGTYKPVFIITKSTSTQLELQGLESHLPVTLNLRERTPCVQKPL